MASKLTKAVKVKAERVLKDWHAYPDDVSFGELAMLVPMAEYKALVKCANPELVRAHTKLISERLTKRRKARNAK